MAFGAVGNGGCGLVAVEAVGSWGCGHVLVGAVNMLSVWAVDTGADPGEGGVGARGVTTSKNVVRTNWRWGRHRSRGAPSLADPDSRFWWVKNHDFISIFKN